MGQVLPCVLSLHVFICVCHGMRVNQRTACQFFTVWIVGTELRAQAWQQAASPTDRLQLGWKEVNVG